MKVWCVKDAGGELLANMSSSFSCLPKALPWIEPSINCLHQESVLSLMIGNIECAIVSMCSLMEHVLRLAIVNKNDCHEMKKYILNTDKTQLQDTSRFIDAKGMEIIENALQFAKSGLKAKL